MSKTLMQQEAESTWQKVADQLDKNQNIISKISAELKARNIKRVITIARGSSDCVANFATYLFGTQLGWSVSSFPPSLATIYGQNIGDINTLVIAISQSGGSPDLRLALESCKKAGCLTLAVVNEENSPLADASDLVLPVRADKENAVAATKSVITSLVALTNIIVDYQQDQKLKHSLLKLPNALHEATQYDWDSAIKILKDQKNMFVIGRGFSYPIAQEMALKFKETCGIHAEAFSGAEVLHGPFALMNQSFTAFTISQDDQSFDGTIDIVKRMSDIGVKTIFVSSKNVDDLDVKSLLSINDKVHPILQPIVTLQAFYIMVNKLALELGFNPDSPVNLKKVTETI